MLIENRFSIQKALLLIAGSIAVTLSLAFGSYAMYGKMQRKKLCSDRYKLTALVQTGPEKEALKTVYLAELLGLSVDCPQNLYALDLKKAANALLSSPLIAKAKVKRLPLNTVYVDYEVRRPVAWISDYRNTAIDREGYLFPIAPFLSPKEMPEIYLGLPPFEAAEDSFGRRGGRWRTPLVSRYLNLAFDLLQTFEGSPWQDGLRIQRIDVSNAFAPSLGRREIVLFTEEEIAVKKGEREIAFTFPKILRLAPKDWKQQLQNFFALRKTMVEDYKKQLTAVEQEHRFEPRIVDLRVPQLAFIEN
jgi:POTRA domain, FtsQ-type